MENVAHGLRPSGPRTVMRLETRGRASEELGMRPPRIVLAEDDPELRRLIGSVLRRDGYDVLELVDGAQLLEYLVRQSDRNADAPDLIVSDIRMPGCTGLDVLAGVRRRDWATPVVLITAFGDRDTHEEAERLGAVAVFDKPFDLDDLRTAVLNVVSHKPV